jgi:hypothetical protein
MKDNLYLTFDSKYELHWNISNIECVDNIETSLNEGTANVSSQEGEQAQI